MPQTWVRTNVSSQEPAPRRRGRKGLETAERILDAAEEVFAEKGYAGTTLREVLLARPRMNGFYTNSGQVFLGFWADQVSGREVFASVSIRET